MEVQKHKSFQDPEYFPTDIFCYAMMFHSVHNLEFEKKEAFLAARVCV